MISNSSNKILEFEDKFYICRFTREQNLEDNLNNKLGESAESSQPKNNHNKNKNSKTKPKETYTESSEFLPF